MENLESRPDDASVVLALLVSYKGSAFAGFARQPGQLTVQGSIEEALSLIFRRPIETVCAGRTDSGVHARGQVVSFSVGAKEWAERSAFKLHRSLNALTHEDISVKEIEEKDDDFSARFSATMREYRYFLCVDKYAPLFMRDFSWHLPKDLDISAMRRAASYLIGEHDFKSFCLAASAGGKPTSRFVKRISVDPDELWGENLVVITVEGNAFLHSMVRTIVGTLVAVGVGNRSPEWVEEVLAARNRSAAGENAPAQGLVFWQVSYEGERVYVPQYAGDTAPMPSVSLPGINVVASHAAGSSVVASAASSVATAAPAAAAAVSVAAGVSGLSASSGEPTAAPEPSVSSQEPVQSEKINEEATLAEASKTKRWSPMYERWQKTISDIIVTPPSKELQERLQIRNEKKNMKPFVIPRGPSAGPISGSAFSDVKDEEGNSTNPTFDFFARSVEETRSKEASRAAGEGFYGDVAWSDVVELEDASMSLAAGAKPQSVVAEQQAAEQPVIVEKKPDEQSVPAAQKPTEPSMPVTQKPAEEPVEAMEEDKVLSIAQELFGGEQLDFSDLYEPLSEEEIARNDKAVVEGLAGLDIMVADQEPDGIVDQKLEVIAEQGPEEIPVILWTASFEEALALWGSNIGETEDDFSDWLDDIESGQFDEYDFTQQMAVVEPTAEEPAPMPEPVPELTSVPVAGLVVQKPDEQPASTEQKQTEGFVEETEEDAVITTVHEGEQLGFSDLQDPVIESKLQQIEDGEPEIRGAHVAMQSAKTDVLEPVRPEYMRPAHLAKTQDFQPVKANPAPQPGPDPSARYPFQRKKAQTAASVSASTPAEASTPESATESSSSLELASE